MAGGMVFYPKCCNFFDRLGNPLFGILSILVKVSKSQNEVLLSSIFRKKPKIFSWFMNKICNFRPQCSVYPYSCCGFQVVVSCSKLIVVLAWPHYAFLRKKWWSFRETVPSWKNWKNKSNSLVHFLIWLLGLTWVS